MEVCDRETGRGPPGNPVPSPFLRGNLRTTVDEHPVNIICNEPSAQVGDPTGVSFIAFVEFLPRPGDRLVLDDGTDCTVQRVHWKTAHIPGSKMVMLVPNVDAVRTRDKDG